MPQRAPEPRSRPVIAAQHERPPRGPQAPVPDVSRRSPARCRTAQPPQPRPSLGPIRGSPPPEAPLPPGRSKDRKRRAVRAAPPTAAAKVPLRAGSGRGAVRADADAPHALTGGARRRRRFPTWRRGAAAAAAGGAAPRAGVAAAAAGPRRRRSCRCT